MQHNREVTLGEVGQGKSIPGRRDYEIARDAIRWRRESTGCTDPITREDVEYELRRNGYQVPDPDDREQGEEGRA